MDEQRDRSRVLLHVSDTARRSLHATPDRRWFVPIHGSIPPRRCRGNVRFVQLLCALITAHLNRLAADLDLDAIYIRLAVASRASFLNTDIALRCPSAEHH